MFRVKNLAVLGVACCLLVVVTNAQMGPQMGMMQPPSMQGVFNPVIGSGAAYEMTDKNQRKSKMEISIVGKESVSGKDAYWMETGIQEPKSNGMLYMKMLIALAEGNTITERMIIQMPGQAQPIEMSMQLGLNANRGGANQQVTDIRSKSQRIGTESVTVPAGTFECEHWKMTDGSGDVWISSKVAPWGLVKMVGKDTSMLLMKTITDAKDHITGKPISMQEMMQQKMQQP